jgi:hypothetical protein
MLLISLRGSGLEGQLLLLDAVLVVAERSRANQAGTWVQPLGM